MRFILVGLIAAGCAVSGFAQSTDTRLFALQGEPRAVGEANRSSIASVRETEIVFPAQIQLLMQGRRLTIPLFDNREFLADAGQLERRASDDLTWRGKIGSGDTAGDVVITFRKGYVAALIYSPHAVYEIVPRGSKHFLVELDQSMFPECGGGVADKMDAVPARASENIAGVDSGDRIDVLVVYTTASKTILGGDAQAQAFAQQAIDTTNTAYINSKIRQRVRLVHSEEFVYTETGNASTDLSNLRNSAAIQTLRDNHKADLVAEIGEITGACGIGYLMNAQGGVVNNAFTVTARSCAVGNLSFPHELGHNMGSHHNPENAGTPIFSYGYGHYINGNYRTVMSYVDPCPSGCTRRPYFSNPSVIYSGVPTGLITRDNARLINVTADWVAGYRYSGSSITMSNYYGGEWMPRQVARNVTWTSDNVTGNVRIEVSRDESTNWETLIASTPNDGTEAVRVGGRATRRARLRIVSLSSPTVSDSSSTNIGIW